MQNLWILDCIYVGAPVHICKVLYENVLTYNKNFHFQTKETK